ncbi:NADPH-dependent FMN reductase [Streptomyces sp. Ncost-T10-10d]|uniref:NADPH-dependent FMN reductase n=1 Tax=Streptomyces sp. Ncost-T10-10d TaxID=1839774 RepID=UPI00081DDE25|nr:NAD(P)H-dependent oxidoreductase [Streptomyces sp. Ncost-T10-10d]SCF76923.1 NAD(P)H-dependent FMN reductase [Streptomyces sp. Ncost-T10-10d]
MDLTATSSSIASTTAATAPLKVAVILASNREGRFAPVVSDWFLSRTIGRPDIETDLIDIAELDLPIALSYRPDADAQAQLASVSTRLAKADAFVVITPEYNHSYPAPLKNLIDRHHAEWQAKPVAFVSYGGVSGGLRAVEHLRQVFAELHSVGIRETVSFHNAGALFDDEGRHKDPAGCDAAAKTLLDQLVWWGRTLRDAKAVHPYGV